MRVLRFFEWIASVLLIVCAVLGLGKVFVDQVVAMAAPRARTSTVWVAPLSEEEKVLMAAHLRAGVEGYCSRTEAEMKLAAGGVRP